MSGNIKKHGGQNRLTYRAQDGTIVGLSYKVPVFVLTPEGKAFISEKFWSVTTSRHRNLFVREAGVTPAEISEETLRGMATTAQGVWS